MRMLMVSMLVLGAGAIALADEGRDPRPEGPKAKERERLAPGQEDRGGPGEMPNLGRLFKALDANGDGKIDLQEMERRFPEVTARWLEARRSGGDRPERPRGEMAERIREKAREREGDAERPKEARHPGHERPEGAPPALGEPLTRLVEAKVNEAIDRRLPEITRRIREMVAKEMREIMERRAPEIAGRVRELVDREVREALDRPGAGREGARPYGPAAGRYRPGPGGPRAFAPPRGRGWADIPEFGELPGKAWRERCFGGAREPWGRGEGRGAYGYKRQHPRLERPWGPERWERPAPPPPDGREGRRWRDGRDGRWDDDR